MNRRAMIIGISLTALLAAPAPAAASSGGEKKDEKKKEKEKPLPLPKPGKDERYAKIPTIALELWDKHGSFHLSTVDLLILVPETAKFSEKVLADKMRKVLMGIAYEEYMAANPAPMIKASMLDLVRKEPGLEMTKDLLIAKMLFR
ncbi:conserved exported hypothetical protein [Candidatus Terasakiella magnetica]|nr:conserved exported hypothetical protein [Candidatus Terasakiella magnetica]